MCSLDASQAVQPESVNDREGANTVANSTSALIEEIIGSLATEGVNLGWDGWFPTLTRTTASERQQLKEHFEHAYWELVENVAERMAEKVAKQQKADLEAEWPINWSELLTISYSLNKRATVYSITSRFHDNSCVCS